MMTKYCPKCKTTKDISLFYSSKGKIGGWCKDCHNESCRKRYHNKTPEVKKRLNQKNRLSVVYGLTVDDYNKMCLERNNCCEICGRDITDNIRALCVDHNHKTKQIRGILCDDCNTALGFLKVDEMGIDLLASAISYIRNSGRVIDNEVS